MTELSEEENKLALEHRDALLDVRAILATDPGRRFFKYLFKYFEVGQLPEFGLEDKDLVHRLGMLRPGRALFELVSEADADMAATFLAYIEKERYAELIKNSSITRPS